MTKQIITYILFAACFLSACSSDYTDFEQGTDASENDLTLTVVANDIVVSDGNPSRAYDNGPSTVFEEGECVGLIALDKEGRLLADNVPYKYDGSNWVFDADNEEGRERVYYDATMSTYIVYYPYDKSANGVKDISELKSLPVFAYQEDQSEEEVYRHCDLMVWTQTENLKKDLEVKLGHVRNSFSLDIKLNWELPGLPGDNHLVYRPLRKALIDFEVRLEDGTHEDGTHEDDTHIVNWNDSIDKTFHAEDLACRYILPDGYTGKITWRYTYRGESFGGESTISAAVGVRYVHHTIADISSEKVEPFDYYSYKTINGINYGFVMPWDAAECFEDYNPIGIVFYVGQHSRDNSDYTSSGIGQKECHGYLVALADAFLPDAADPDKSFQLKWANPDADNNIPNVTGITDTGDWSGFYCHKKIEEYIGNEANNTEWAKFPASYACETYVGLDGIKMAPSNTSGWFLPTSNMLNYIMNDSKFNEAFKTVVKYADTTIENPSPDKPLFESSTVGYWSSTENELSDKDTHTELKRDNDGNPIQAKDNEGNLLYEDKDKKIPKYETVVIVDAERHYAYFMIISNNIPSISAISKSTAKFVRPVLAF